MLSYKNLNVDKTTKLCETNTLIVGLCKLPNIIGYYYLGKNWKYKGY